MYSWSRSSVNDWRWVHISFLHEWPSRRRLFSSKRGPLRGLASQLQMWWFQVNSIQPCMTKVPQFLLSFRYFLWFPVPLTQGLTKPPTKTPTCLQSSTFAAWKALHKNVHLNVAWIKKKNATNDSCSDVGRCLSVRTRPRWCHQACVVDKIPFPVWAIQFKRHWQYREAVHGAPSWDLEDTVCLEQKKVS